MDTNARFVTADVWLSAFLLAKGFPLAGTVNGRRLLFAFLRTAELNAAIVDYSDDAATINPQSLRTAMLEIRRLIYGGQQTSLTPSADPRGNSVTAGQRTWR